MVGRVVFTPEEVAAVARVGRRLRYRPRDFVFLQGDPSECVFLLVSGRVRLSRLAGDGREFILEFLKPGELFGELALADDAPRETVAEAGAPSEAVAVQKEEFEALLVRRPDLAVKVARILSRRNKRMADRVEDLVFRDVPARLAGLLLALADEFGVGGERGTRFLFKITQRELASCIGSSRETVSQVLTSFARARVIVRDGRQIVITAPDRLGALAAGASDSGR